MTMTTDFVTTESRPGGDDTGNGIEPHWSDQVVLSGAGLLSGGIERTRVNTEALLDVADSLVLGTLDLIDEWTSLSAQLLPQLYPMLTTEPAKLARQTYVAATRAVREGVIRA
jgi:hypothetical protein